MAYSIDCHAELVANHDLVWRHLLDTREWYRGKQRLARDSPVEK